MSRNISPEEKQSCESFAFPFMVAYTFSVLAPNTFRRLCPDHSCVVGVQAGGRIDTLIVESKRAAGIF